MDPMQHDSKSAPKVSPWAIVVIVAAMVALVGAMALGVLG